MTNLVERLRNNCSCNFPDTPCGAEEECRNAFEGANRIEKLETANLKQSLIMVGHLSRIEELEAALRDLSDGWECCPVSKAMRRVAHEALEGKDD